MLLKSLVVCPLILASLSTAYALEAGPVVFTGTVESSNGKVLVISVGNQEAEIPAKLVPSELKKSKDKLAVGKKVAIAMTEEQSKQVKVHKK